MQTELNETNEDGHVFFGFGDDQWAEVANKFPNVNTDENEELANNESLSNEPPTLSDHESSESDVSNLDATELPEPDLESVQDYQDKDLENQPGHSTVPTKLGHNL